MARTKTNTRDDTKTLTTSWRNRHLENIYFCVFRYEAVGDQIHDLWLTDWNLCHRATATVLAFTKYWIEPSSYNTNTNTRTAL